MAVDESEDAGLVEQVAAMGRRIRAEREHQCLTLADLASRARIGLQTLIRIEDGSPGVALANVQKVLGALDLPSTLAPEGYARDYSEPLHPVHIEDAELTEAVEDAVRLACRRLDDFFNDKFGDVRPEVNGISSNFQGLLEMHVRAMLKGEMAHKASHRTELHKLVYSDGDLGGPRYAPSAAGWVLRARGTSKVLQDGRAVSMTSEVFDPYTSREAAERAFRDSIERHGHPATPLDAIPVYLVSDRWSFTN